MDNRIKHLLLESLRVDCFHHESVSSVLDCSLILSKLRACRRNFLAMKKLSSFITAYILLSVTSFSFAQEAPQVIEPDLERRTIKIDAIDKENFEIGVFAGLMSIQDFDSSGLLGARVAYHISEDFFVEATYGQAKGDLTSFEELSGSSPLFTDEDRELSYYDISAGLNLFPGEVFLFGKRAMNSSFYLTAGVGSTQFAGDSWFSVAFGGGLRLLLTDSIAFHIGAKDLIFNRDVLGEDEQTHNLQFHTGFTFFF